jgi:hypothetical protein
MINCFDGFYINQVDLKICVSQYFLFAAVKIEHKLNKIPEVFSNKFCLFC